MIEAIGVTLKKNGLVYYFASDDDFNVDDMVIVETEKGLQVGYIKHSKKNIKAKDFMLPLKKILRKVTEEDLIQLKKNIKDAADALANARKYATNLNLNMTFVDANFTFERTQLFLYFIADGRVDFRELARKLAQIYKTRIELRQIGVRDKAREIGGLGPCGRFLCCNTFLTDFDSVSINMAKNQSLALNPTKINGVCGRLLCCLNYEDSVYTELRKNLPTIGSFIDTKEGKVKVIEVDIFKRKCKVVTSNNNVISIDLAENEDGSNK